MKQYNFIIPYRNRKEHLDKFIECFKDYFEGTDIDAKFYIIHQCNSELFNRGAMKNIGFLEISKIRPDGLFIFNDVDTYPTYNGSIDYNTDLNTIKRPVRNMYPDNLGPICCFWKKEFELVNGFPNYYGWGAEDASIYYRTIKYNILVNQNNIIKPNSDKCYRPQHYVNYDKQREEATINGKLFDEERQSGIYTNGLSNLQYEVLSQFELMPNFTLINVDFKVL